MQSGFSERQFHFISKLLHLYLECILTKTEVLEQLAEVSQVQQLQMPAQEEVFHMLKRLVEQTEFARRKLSFFVPLSSIDFSKKQRFTHSYVSMPASYPKECSCASAFSRSILNELIVTVPRGTEHKSFMIMRKNEYEEALFNSEDQKYELDISINHLKHFRKYLKHEADHD